jgi:hypothetical protein
MIEKFAIVRIEVWSEFLDLNRTSQGCMSLVSLMLPKLAPTAGRELWRALEAGH